MSNATPNTPNVGAEKQKKNNRHLNFRNELVEALLKKSEKISFEEWLTDVENGIKEEQKNKEELNEIQANDSFEILKIIENQGIETTFQDIANEKLSLHQLITGKEIYSAEALSTRLQHLKNTGGDIDRAIAEKFREKFFLKLPEAYKAKARDEIRRSKPLAETINDIDFFLKKYPNLTINPREITLSNGEILNLPPLQPTAKKIKESPSNKRDTNTKKLFNTLLFHQEIGAIRELMDYTKLMEKNFTEAIKGKLKTENVDELSTITGIPKEVLQGLIDIQALPNGEKFQISFPDGTRITGEKADNIQVIDLPNSDFSAEENRQKIKMMFPPRKNDPKKIEIKNVGDLIVLRMIIKRNGESSPINTIISDEKNTEETPGKKDEKNTEETVETKTEKKEKIETERDIRQERKDVRQGKIKGYSFKQSKGEEIPGFIPGTVLAIKEKSIMPPKDKGDARVYLKITKIHKENGCFEAEIYGGERSDPVFEGATKTVHIENIMKMSNELYKFPDPNRQDETGSSIMQKLKSAGFKDMNQFNDIKRDKKDGFVKEKISGKQEPITQVIGEEQTIYDIKHNRHTHTYDVSCDSIKLDGKKYSRKMDYLAFCMFMREKALTPYTKTEMEIEKKNAEYQKPKMVNQKKLGRTFLSIYGLKEMIKGNRKKLMTERIKKNEQAQIDAANEWLMNSGLLNVIGKIPLAGMAGAVQQIQQERYDKREDKRRANIEKYLKKFDTSDFGDIFDQKYRHNILGMSMQDFAKSDRTLEGEDLYKGAALLLAMAKKGKSIYRGIPELKGTGHWVKKLLGPAYHTHFIQMRDQYLRDGTLRENKKNYNSDLIKLEMEYIIKNIQGNPNGKFGLFGSIDDRGILDKESTIQREIDNPARQRLGTKFAEELDNRTKDLNTKDNIGDEYRKMGNYTWEQAVSDFGKLKDGRTQISIAAVLKMGDLITSANPEQVSTLKRCMLTLLLSGILTTDLDGNGKKLIYQLCKKLNFPVGYLARDNEYAKKLRTFLQEATRGEFEKTCKVGDKPYKFDDFFPTGFPSDKQPAPNYKNLISGVEKWRNQKENREALEKFSHETLVAKNRNENAYLKEFKDKVLDTDPEGLGGEREGNDVISLCARLDSNINIIAKNTRYDNEEFEGKDEDQKNMKAEFWKNINKELDATKNNATPEKVTYIARGFCNLFSNKGFGKSSLPTFVERISIANQYYTNPNMQSEKANTITTINKDEIELGRIGEDDIKKLLRRSTVGEILSRGNGNPPTEMMDGLTKFYEFFRKNLETLASDSVIKEAFGLNSKNIEGEYPKKLANRKIYQKTIKNNPTIEELLNNDIDIDDLAEFSQENLQTKKDKEMKRKEKRVFETRTINKELFDTERICMSRGKHIKIPPEYRLSI